MLARLTSLARNLAVYGLGDVATNIVSFLLLPLYVHFLTPGDYGAIGLLLSVEVLAKILFRWGIDASFMRFYFDCETDTDRQRLASTLFWFLAAVSGGIVLLLVLAAPWLAVWIGLGGYEWPLRLVLLNTFAIGFYFLPFHVLRIGQRSRTFVTLTTTRSAATLVARLILIVGAGHGVLGFVLADVVVTLAFTAVLAKWFRPLIRPMFSRTLLREALRFGLPRLPHGLAQQVMIVADRYVLGLFAGLAQVGLYTVGASFGTAMKLFLGAFEYAWAPFYFSLMKEPDAKPTFTMVTTYGIAVLVLLEAGLAAIAHDLVRLMTQPDFYAASQVIPWIGLGVVFQGVYLLTSIGLNITKQTKFYPMATGIAAATSVAGNLLLVPRFGALGAGWANALSYAVLAGTALVLSQRVYPIPLEYGRIARLAIAGVGAWLAASLFPATLSPLAGVLARGVVVCITWPLLLLVLGFYDPRELRTLGRIVARMRGRPSAPASTSPTAPVEREPTLVEDRTTP